MLGERRKVVSGGQCPKYDEVSPAGEKLPREAPNPYRERDGAAPAGSSARRPAARVPTGLVARPAVRALPHRHAAVLPHAASPPGARRARAAPRPGHAGRGRPALRRARRLRPGQAAARPRRSRGGRVRGAALRAPAGPQRRRCHVHVPHGPGRAGHGGARPRGGGLAGARAAAGALREGGRGLRRRRAPAAPCGAPPTRSPRPPGAVRWRPARSRAPTTPPWTRSAASRRACTTSARARWRGRASTTIRSCSWPARRT